MSNLRGFHKEKGGSPEDARHEVSNMKAVAEAVAPLKVGRIIPSTDTPERKAGMWIDQQVELSKKDGVLTLVKEVGPVLARALLNRNDGNRKVRDQIVTAYARDMANDAWRFNGEPIIVSSDGKLNDGQHRCEAIIRCDREIQAVLVIGVDRDTRTTLDQGKTRRVGDFLAMEGYSNANQIGIVASMAWQYVTLGRMAINTSERPTKSEILEFVEDHPNIIQSHATCYRKGVHVVGGIAAVSTAHWIFTQRAGKSAADEFVFALIEGANLKSGNPILYVRNRLVIEGRRLRAADRMELLIKAWNSHRAKQTVRAYSISGGALPKVAG